jgi:hypothetical protein
MLLLQKLTRPDVPNLVSLVARNLKHKRSSGFGSLPIHRKLLRPQLDELAQLSPSLLGEDAFVRTYVRRLAQSGDVAWPLDERERGAVPRSVVGVRAAAARARKHTFKGHVLYHHLAHDLSRGALDREMLLAYLRLPRPFEYVREKLRGHGVDAVKPDESFETGFESVANDEELVRKCLEHLMVSEDSYAAYAELIEESLPATRLRDDEILAGVGDMERWYSLLDDPRAFEALKERVDCCSRRRNAKSSRPTIPVTIDLDLKNVPVLLVRVFSIDAYGFQRDHDADVDESIELDGLVANEEQTYATPSRRSGACAGISSSRACASRART